MPLKLDPGFGCRCPGTDTESETRSFADLQQLTCIRTSANAFEVANP